MAGRVYGTEQDKWYQREVRMQRSRGAFELAEIVEGARDAVEGSFHLNREAGRDLREEAREIAIELRRLADGLEKAPAIDERSNAIKKRLIELIKKRADAFDAAVGDSMIAAAASADREAFEQVFKEFSEWENDTLEEFQRIFER